MGKDESARRQRPLLHLPRREAGAGRRHGHIRGYYDADDAGIDELLARRRDPRQRALSRAKSGPRASQRGGLRARAPRTQLSGCADAAKGIASLMLERLDRGRCPRLPRRCLRVWRRVTAATTNAAVRKGLA